MQGSFPGRPSATGKGRRPFLILCTTGIEGAMIRDQQSLRAWILAAIVLCFQIVCFSSSVQDLSLEQKITAITKTETGNQAELVEYTWQQQEILKVKDKIEDQRLFQGEFGVDGRTGKMPVDLPEDNSASQNSERGIREWLVQKKQHAVRKYAEEVKELAESYAEAGPELLRSAYKRRDISIKPAEPGITRLFIHNYVKPGDTATLTFDQNSNELQNLEVLSYLSSTKEPIEIRARFSRLQNGPGHIDEISAVAGKRKLSVLIRRLDYRHK
jgi:hypothetical protein